MPDVTVAIPVRDGGELFRAVLVALAGQTLEHELIVCDSGSTDQSVASARAHGARVLEIPAGSFSHGGVRNQLIREASGAHVALLSQDAEPAGERWLERLLSGFAVHEDVGIVYGPYLARAGASPAVRIELERWFRSLSPQARPRVDRLESGEVSRPAAVLMGRRGFFTDANACISREAWSRVPFRTVPYAEDRVLAVDMLRAGYAKVYVPDAAVLHSHDYGSLGQLRRSFDEGRALLEVYGWREPGSPRRIVSQLRGELGPARRELGSTGLPLVRRGAALSAVSRHHVMRLAGAILGSRADILPGWARRRVSLERRASFVPLNLDALPRSAPTKDPAQ
jgi:rhamnosyltransferase